MRTINEHIDDIRREGLSALMRKIKVIIPVLVNAIRAIPLALIIRIIKPWRFIRLGPIRGERIGHFVADAGQRWAMRQLQSDNIIDVYWIDRPTCNIFWEKMVRRNFTTTSMYKHLERCNRLIPGGDAHYRPSSISGSRDIVGALERANNVMSFRPEEEHSARSWLKRQGWQEGQAFVCLLVRDDAYLDNDPLHKGQVNLRKGGRGWNYHYYRNSDISTYVPAAEWLADQGIWVLRMGKIMSKPIPSNHPRIIDYAFHSEKNDFLDIWLFANCDLCISTGTGPDMVSDIYRRPLLMVNYLPIKLIISWSNAMHAPKRLIWEETGAALALQEHLTHDYLYAEKYDEAGILIDNLSETEILQAVQERWGRTIGTWIDTQDDINRNKRFWDILKSQPDYHLYHGYVHPGARLGASWMRSVGDYFLQ